MSNRDAIIKALQEEVEQMKKPSDKVTEKEIKLDGDQREIGGKLPNPSSGEFAPGGDKPAIEKPKGKGMTSSKPGKQNLGSGKGEKMDNRGGKGLAAKVSGEVKTSVGGKGERMDNLGGKGVQSKKVSKESIILPHDVLVEKDGKRMTLRAGTRVVLEQEDDFDFSKATVDDEADVSDDDEIGEVEIDDDIASEVGEDIGGEMGVDEIGEDDEVGENGECSVVDNFTTALKDLVDMERSEDHDEESINSIASAIDDFGEKMKEICGEEMEEPEHQDDIEGIEDIEEPVDEPTTEPVGSVEAGLEGEVKVDETV
jgi:hypothetical protein